MRLPIILLLAGAPAIAFGRPPDETSVVSKPPAVREVLVVTATRTGTRLDDSPQSVVVLSAQQIGDSAARTTDDLLRQVPGFSLFRRTSSAAANPTAQGASLRGIGGSGASRALVLLDGVPLNDPFGGWVPWNLAPRMELGRIEVLRGGGSDLYGSSAFGGVINMLTRPAAPGVRAQLAGGTSGLADAHVAASGKSSAGNAGISLDAFNYDGYFAIPDGDRGAVDRRVSSRHLLIGASAGRELGEHATAFLRASWSSEERGNGTALQTNDTKSLHASAGTSFIARDLAVDARVYATDQTYHQTFSSVGPGRDGELLTRLQTVPSWSVGFSGQVSRAFARQVVVAGADLRQVNGWSDESTLAGFASRVGGRQRTTGIFAEDLVEIATALTATAAVRYDIWGNFDATNRTREGTVRLPDREDDALSPRVSLSWRSSDRLTISASSYRAFRAPTLNELYRSFRLGSVITLANDDLAPERLAGHEIGAIVKINERVSVRANVFEMNVSETIVNVTRTVTPTLITRQRDNVGRTRSRGIEADFDARISPLLAVAAGYLYVQPVVRAFQSDPTLTGLDLPQVPRQQATLQLQSLRSSIRTTLQARWTATQFDDDRNQLRLAGVTAVDAYVARPLPLDFEIFAAVENLFDQRPEVGRTPNLTLGAPRSLSVGVRYGY